MYMLRKKQRSKQYFLRQKLKRILQNMPDSELLKYDPVYGKMFLDVYNKKLLMVEWVAEVENKIQQMPQNIEA